MESITVRCGANIELIATVHRPRDNMRTGALISLAAAVKATQRKGDIVYQSTVRIPLPAEIEAALLADDEIYESIIMQAEYKIKEKRNMREDVP